MHRGSIRLSVRLFVCALSVEPFDLRPLSFAWSSGVRTDPTYADEG